MRKHIGGKIGSRIGEFEVVSIGSLSVDGNLGDKRGDEVHVWPEKVVPVTDITFDNKADVVDKPIVVPIEVCVRAHQLQGLHILQRSD